MELIEEKVFKDPIHQYIYVKDKLIWDLINTKEFQRLRRIKQLGTTFFTFHGAEHSRFAHSLGVYEITRKIISLFERNHYIDWTEEEKLVVQVAALLHDVGHGPFSHSIEKVFSCSHEEWSKRIISEKSEINKLLIQTDPMLPDHVVQVIQKNYPKPVIVNMISGHLDADRMDYLLRDAYYTGVNYGTFDIERILRVIRPLHNRLVVKESGMHSVEDYLMSRYQMYWQVYFHPVTRSGEVILRKIFLRAKYLYENNYTFSTLFQPIQHLLEENLSLQDYLFLDDPIIYTIFHFWENEKDEILADLSSRFIHRRLFQYIEFDAGNREKRKAVMALLQANGINPDYYLEFDSPSNLSYDIYQPNEDEYNSPIHILTKGREIIEISKKSEVISSLMGRRKTNDDKIYFPIDILEEQRIYNDFVNIINSY